MKAIDATKAYPYVAKEERKLMKDDQTRFMIKYLDCVRQAELQDDLYNVEGMGKERRERLLTGTRMTSILETNLVGWENFMDHDGNPVPFDKADPKKNINKIPPRVRQELADAIAGEGDVSEGEGNG